MAKNLSGMGVLIVCAILGILVASFAQEIGTSVAEQTNYLVQVNESFTYTRVAAQAFSVNTTQVYVLSHVPTATNNFTFPAPTFTLGNGTALVNGTDYAFNSLTGQFTMLNTTKTFPVTNNVTLVTSQYETANYINDDASRNLTGLIPLLFVIGGLVVLVAYLWNKGHLAELLTRYK